MNTLKKETKNNLQTVAKQIIEAGAFGHFTKMVLGNLPANKVQDTLIEKYNLSSSSLDYLYKGVDDKVDEMEISLLIAISCDEIKMQKPGKLIEQWEQINN